MEDYRTGTGQLLRVHDRYRCTSPSACVIHEPSDHHMIGWKTHWRADRRIMERLCKHGIGHPDPDSRDPDGTHGCDGCCISPEKVIRDQRVIAIVQHYEGL